MDDQRRPGTVLYYVSGDYVGFGDLRGDDHAARHHRFDCDRCRVFFDGAAGRPDPAHGALRAG